MFELVGWSGELGLPPARSCSDQELIDALGEAARREAMCAERKLAYATELHRRRVRQDEADGVSCADRGRGTVAEIAAALTVGRGTAASLLHLGRELAGRLPATGRALAAGDIDLSRARIISDATVALHAEQAALVEHRVLPRLIGRNAGQARRILTDTVTRVDPGAASTRRVLAERDRDVSVQPAEDGMSTLWATLPAADALTLDAQLGAMATGVCTQDPRTLGQRRADALVALAHHETGLRCACGNTCYTHHAPPRPVPLIRVIADASTLLRLTDTPGHLDGYGTIDPDLTRRLATDATWQQLLTAATTPGDTPVPVGIGPARHAGQLPQATNPATVGTATVSAAELDARFHADRYRRYPGTDLRAFIQLRDRTCRHPGCLMPAANCDIDHTTAYNTHNPTRGGLTVPSNLACLCRYHHNLKTRGYWAVQQHDYGELVFTTPTGHTHTTTPPTPNEWNTHLTDRDYNIWLDQLVRDNRPPPAAVAVANTPTPTTTTTPTDPNEPPPF